MKHGEGMKHAEGIVLVKFTEQAFAAGGIKEFLESIGLRVLEDHSPHHVRISVLSGEEDQWIHLFRSWNSVEWAEREIKHEYLSGF